MANYDAKTPASCLSFHKYRKSKLIGIASPLGRCGKTSLALSLGLKLSQNHSCLFISFDECSPLKTSLFKKQINNSSLADIIYYYLQSMDISDNRILSCFQTFQGMDYIPPSEQLGTYSELQSEELLNFILNILKLGKYDYIIIDWSLFSFDYSLLKVSNILLVPTIENDIYSSQKITSFFDTISSQYKNDLITTKKVNLPLTSFTPVSSEYTFSLTSLALGNFITTLIQELNL
jgi:cellulose biosynthesis protein BcsQ